VSDQNLLVLPTAWEYDSPDEDFGKGRTVLAAWKTPVNSLRLLAFLAS
jgi:hypothetical protein